jgi:hypothetical protein
MTETVFVAILSSSVLATLVTKLFDFFDKKRQKDDAIQLILYHDIKMECKEYISQGSIDSDGLEVLIKMHEAYHKHGGNGYLDKLMCEAKKLPISES